MRFEEGGSATAVLSIANNNNDKNAKNIFVKKRVKE